MKKKQPENIAPIAIIGIGCVFPKAKNSIEYWSNIKNRVNAITEVPETHWKIKDYFDKNPKVPDHTYVTKGGFIPPVDFNPMEFGIIPKALEAIDTSQLIGLLVAKMAMEDAGYGMDRSFDRKKTSVILGVTGAQELVIPLGARLDYPLWRRALNDAGLNGSLVEKVIRVISDSYIDWQEDSFPGLLGNVVAGRIANVMDLGGTNCVVDAACASSLSALYLACLELTSGKSDMALTGGVDTFNSIFMYMCFSKTPALSPSNDIRPFDQGADGTMLGEGVGMVVLKRLEDAQRDGDRIYGVIRSIGTASDGKGQAVFAPGVGGQVAALKEAYRLANVSPRTIELLEAHGTGTKVGDIAELTSLSKVYSPASKDNRWCALGSVKSQIGHTKAAAGVASLIKAVLALHHKVIPPTINIEHPQQLVATEKTPFYPSTELRPWLSNREYPKRAAVSSFGFGGSNFHCLLEEFKADKNEIDWNYSVQIIAFSGGSRKELAEELLVWQEPLSWEEIIQKADESRKTFELGAPFRLLMVIEKERSKISGMITAARSFLEKQTEQAVENIPGGIYFGEGKPSGQIGMLFPGQGTQYTGMFRDLACHFPQMYQILCESNDIFHINKPENIKKQLIDFIYPPPVFNEDDLVKNESALRDTRISQPALGAVCYGAFNVLKEFGVVPYASAGHSYGELTALCAAGRIDPDEFYRISTIRGKLMAQTGSDSGAMLAVQSDLQTVTRIIKEHSLKLTIANKNAPEQIVLSGAVVEINTAEKILGSLGLNSTKLAVSAAFHSPLVSKAQSSFEDVLSTIRFRKGTFSVFSNTTAQKYPVDPEKARSLFATQLVKPVLFHDEILAMYEYGIRTFIDTGPKKVLTGLVKSIFSSNDKIRTISLDSSNGERNGFYDLAQVIAQIAAEGHRINLSLWNPVSNYKKLFSKPSKISVPVSGANYKNPARTKKREPVSDVNNHIVSEPVIEESADEAVSEQKLSATPQETTIVPENIKNMHGPEVDNALRIIRHHIEILQTMQEQTAKLHQQFLEEQNMAFKTFQALVEQQQQLLQDSFGINLSEESAGLSLQNKQLISEPSESGTVAPEFSEQPEEQSSSLSVTIDKTADILQILLKLVSEKTGYPVEMLEPDMSLDMDLGIDSIKRVEIFSALNEKLPAAGEIKAEHAGTLKTLRKVAEFIAGRESKGSESYTSEPVLQKPKEQHAELTSASPGTVEKTGDVLQILLELVSEKTGYPVEMLEPDMSLDMDLGIDSIKRVEIFSALNEKLPAAGEIKAEHAGTLKTLRKVAECIAGAGEKGSEASAEKLSAQTNVQEEKTPVVERKEVTAWALSSQDLSPDREKEKLVLPEGSEIWITDDCSPLSKKLQEHLKSLGYNALIISKEGPSGIHIPSMLGGLIIMAPCNIKDDSFLKKSLKLLQCAAPGLRKAGKEGGAVFVTVSRLDGCFGLGNLAPTSETVSGGLAGLSKTAGHEWPEVLCKALDVSSDLPSNEKTAEEIVDEMFLRKPVEVGFSKKGRTTLGLSLLPSKTSERCYTFNTDDVLIITGGARGITAVCAEEMARSFPEKKKPVMVLLGRSKEPFQEPGGLQTLDDEKTIKKEIIQRAGKKVPPQDVEREYRMFMANREILNTLSRIESAGVQVLYRSVDVRDSVRLKEIVDSVRSTIGPIKGIIHAAGVIADSLIENKNDDEFDRVYLTKIQGMRNLLQITEQDDLNVIAVFSSTTARFGRTGQVDYAIANEVLNKIVQQQARLRPTCRVVSMNWGPWDGGMVTPALKQIFIDEGIDLIPKKIGAEYLIDEICATSDKPVEIIVMGKESINENFFSETGFKHCAVAFKRILSVEEAPVLQSHVIDARSVLPLSLTVEFLAQGALHSNPGLLFHGFNDLRVLKGIKLKKAESREIHVFAGKTVKSGAFFTLPVELKSLDDKGNYSNNARAVAVLTTQPPAAVKADIALDLEPYFFTPEQLYRDFLFHGTLLQGIKHIEGCSSQGIAGTSSIALKPSSWIKHPLRNTWIADPLVLDCCFQMMIVWSFFKYGNGSLPTAIGSYRQFFQFPKESVRIAVRITGDSKSKACADMEITDQKGRLIATIKNYECVIDPLLKKAFENNRIK